MSTTPQRFLVTGGSQGIGAALVMLARQRGHQVVFTGRKPDLIAKVSKDTGAHGVHADVSVDADNIQTVAACLSHMGGIDVLVNNAGFGYSAEIGDLDIATLKSLFATNVFGMVDIANHVTPL